jgi:hypothetical protein
VYDVITFAMAMLLMDFVPYELIFMTTMYVFLLVLAFPPFLTGNIIDSLNLNMTPI